MGGDGYFLEYHTVITYDVLSMRLARTLLSLIQCSGLENELQSDRPVLSCPELNGHPLLIKQSVVKIPKI